MIYLTEITKQTEKESQIKARGGLARSRVEALKLIGCVTVAMIDFLSSKAAVSAE